MQIYGSDQFLPVQDGQEGDDYRTLFVAGKEHFTLVQRQFSEITLVEASQPLCEGAALLLKVACADPSPDGRIVERWLRNIGLASGLAVCVPKVVAGFSEKQSGVGPRSGGGIASSGAGAKRKEGVQPPVGTMSAKGGLS